MMGIYDWSTVADDNDDSDDSINWEENQKPSTVNNSARNMMAEIAKWRDDTSAIVTSGGTGNTYTVTSAIGQTAYVSGHVIFFRVDKTNTDVCLINVNGLGNKSLKATPTRELASGELTAGQIAAAFYDGTQFLLLNPSVGQISLAKLSPRIQGALSQVGEVKMWPVASIPAGWLLADGSAISRSTYSELFGVYGTNYGVGDGSTTFNLPDYRGEFLRGYDSGAGNDPNAGVRTDRGDGTTGDNIGTKQLSEFESHDHDITDPGHVHDTDALPDKSNQSNVSGSNNDDASDNKQTIQSTQEFTGITIDVEGGDETRSRNVSIALCIFASAELSAEALVSGSGVIDGLGYTFDDGVDTSIDPGTGQASLNNAALGSVTEIALSESLATTGNPSVNNFLNNWTNGFIKVTDANNPSNFGIYRINTLTDDTNFKRWSVTEEDSNGSLTDGDPLRITLMGPEISQAERHVTAAGDITMLGSDRNIFVNKTVGAATTVNLITAVGRKSPITIKDEKLDAHNNPITIDANGTETIDGSLTYVINFPGGAITLYPLADETGWYIK